MKRKDAPWSVVAWGAVLVVLGCGCGREEHGVGVGASEGGARCDYFPGPGCACEEGARRPCRLSPIERDGTLYCREGVMHCRQGVWSACESVQQVPATGEDGGEGVGATSEALVEGPRRCSACEPDCFVQRDEPEAGDLPGRSTGLEVDPDTGGIRLIHRTGPCTSPDCMSSEGFGPGTGRDWMPGPDNSEGVVVDPSDGALVLGRTVVNSRGVWIANMNDGTVSKLDPETAREVGRYPSARPDPLNRARPWWEPCNWSNRGNCPSRTAVDQNYDVYVANRAFGNWGTVTKIAGNEERCVDRNGNGTIETSRDLNGDGIINRGTPEFVGPADECILWTVRVGGRGEVPRALAIGLAPPGRDVGDVWVGNFASRRAYRLDPYTGRVLGSVSTAPLRSYGAVSDPQGRIWFSHGGQSSRPLGFVDPGTMSFSLAPSHGVGFGYGVAVWSSPDLSQTYVFIGDTRHSQIHRFDPNTNRWFVRSMASFGWGYRFFRPRGVAADETHLWSAVWTRQGWGWNTISESFVSLRLPNLDRVRRYGVWPRCRACGFVGIGVGYDGAIWAVAQPTNNVVRLAPDRGSAIVTPRIMVAPYTYSDFIGFGLNVFANPRGRYRFQVDGGCAGHRWSRLAWNAVVPAGTSLEFWVRSADTTGALSAQPWIGPFTGSPADLTAAPGPVPRGRYLEVEVRMASTDRRETPRLYDVSVDGSCDADDFVPEGRYTQSYDAASTCQAMGRGNRPEWLELTFDADVPAGTRIDWEIRTSDTASSLAGATPLVLSTPPTASPVDLSTVLLSNGVPPNLFYLSVTAVLRADAMRTASPTLYSFQVRYRCRSAE